MALIQITDTCFHGKTGLGTIDQAVFDKELMKAPKAIAQIRKHYADGSLPSLRLPEKRDDLDAMKKMAAHLSTGATDIAILGIGGSSLGAQAVAALAGFGVASFGSGGFSGKGPRLHFLENLDPHSLEMAAKTLPLATTRFLLVSKSGGTPEPLVQALVMIEALRGAGLGSEIGARFGGIAEPGNNAVRRMAAEFGFPMLDHDPKVGGRYSVLSVVGCLPAILAGLDPVALRSGAERALKPLLTGSDPSDVPSAVGAALNTAAMRGNLSMAVMLPYCDRLEKLAMWYRQLWAESLGKSGHGSTPIRALGPVDQHSQLQLYLDGPADKFYSLILLNQHGQGPRIPGGLTDADLRLFSGHAVGDLSNAMGRATAETLARRGRPVRIFQLEKLDEAALGELLMHFMLETMLAAELLGVDAFDQPAVEEGKKLARAYLSEGRA